MELKNVEIIKIGELKTFDSGFTVVEFVVKTTDEQYPQLLQLQCTKDKAENLLKFNKVGDFVDVSINLRGREWTNPQGEVKYFNTIEAWKVFKAETSDKSIDVKKATEIIDGAFEPAGELNDMSNGDDLPF